MVSIAREMRAIPTIARNKLMIETRYRGKFSLDVLAHLLGLAPVALTAWALSNGRTSARLLELAGVEDHLTFIVLGLVAFSAVGLGSTLMLYTGAPYALAWEQELGTVERQFLAPVRRGTIIVGMTAYFSTLFAYQAVTLFLFGWLVFGLQLNVDATGVALAVVALLSLVLISSALAIIGAGLILAFKQEEVFLLVVSRPMTILSGAYFLIELVPQPFKALAMINPVAYAVDAFRGSLTGQPLLTANPETAAAVAVGVSVGLCLLAVPVYYRMVDHMSRKGTIGLF
jgi:ABC-2 type transport system permease protein